MSTKPSNKTLIGIIAAVAIVAVVAVVAVVVINNNKGASAPSDPASSTNTSDSASDSTSVTATELSTTTPAATISYGDFDAMQSLSKDIQNGRRTGQIVTIDGLVNHPGTPYSIVEPSADGKTKIGTVFTIKDSDTYPADGDRVTITAKVVEVSPMNFQLVTLKDFVKSR